MSATTTTRLARTSSKFADRVRNASIAAAPASGHEHGRDIYVYSHLQTKQVVYSLQQNVKVRSLSPSPSPPFPARTLTPPPKNNKALRQLPYNGKKTIPAALRKDLWSPLARISFPAGAAQAGLDAFRMLREYRKLHESQWPAALALDDKGQPLKRRLRGRKLCDQRANSIADIAAALAKVTRPREAAGEEPAREAVGATVRWSDIFDAEFAESWPETVVHDKWAVTRNHRRELRDVLEEEAGEIALDGEPVMEKAMA